MGLKKWNKRIVNEQGSALVYTLLVLLLLSLLAISVGTVTIGSYKLSDANRDFNSAYYIAEAGANEAYQTFSTKVLEQYETATTQAGFQAAVDALANSKESETILGFEKQFNSPATADVQITGTFDKGYQIVSTGKVGNRERTIEKEVKVNWDDKPSLVELLPKDAVLLVDGAVDLDKGESVDGAIYTSGKVSGSLKNNNVKYEIKPLGSELLPDIKQILPAVPEGLAKAAKIEVEGNQVWRQDAHYSDVTISGTLNINTADGDRTIFINNLTFGNHAELNVVGDGMATIVVAGNLTFINQVKLNVYAKAVNLNITYLGGNDLLFDKVNNSDKPDTYAKVLLVAPDADVRFEKFGLEGTVVSKGFSLGNNSDIRKGETVSTPKTGLEIIETKPAIEK